MEGKANSQEQQALANLEKWVSQARQRHSEYLTFPVYTIGVSDLERLLFYVKRLEYELDYRDKLMGGPGIYG